MELKCNRCLKITEDLSLFSKKTWSKSWYRSICKSCHNEYNRTTWYVRNKDKQIQSSRKYKKENYLKCKASAFRSKWINVDNFDEIHNNNKWYCEICWVKEEIKNLSLDHCHSTNVLRWLLCKRCNTWIWMFGDNIDTIKSAILYLSK